MKITKEDLKASRSNSPSLSKTVAAAFSTPFFTPGEWPKMDWWKMFEDPGLEYCIMTGLQQSPDIQKAFSKLETVQQMANQKKSLLFPSLFFFAEDDYQHLSKNDLYRFPPSQIPAVVNEIELSLNLNYELDFWGKNRSLYRASLGEAKAAFLDFQWTRTLLSVAIAKAYFDWQHYVEKMKLLQSLVEDVTRKQEIIGYRLSFGLDNQMQKYDIHIKKLALQKEWLNVKKDEVLALNNLKFLMGLGPEEKLEIAPKAYFELPFPLPSHLHLDLLAKRPDLMAQIWRIQSYVDLVKAAKAAFYPNVDLRASGGLFSLDYNKLFSVDSLFGSLAPALHLPIFTGGLLKAQLKTRRSEYNAAVYEYNQLILQAAKEVADGLAHMEFLQRELEMQQESLLNAFMNLDLTFSNYKEGIDNYLNVLSAKEQMLFNHIKVIALKHVKNLNALHLIKALGGGYSAERKIEEKP
ncbi:MAG: efflux transporter outer membrane subunit [Simkaniaceae bacterium]